jgi:hypothetical protein
MSSPDEEASASGARDASPPKKESPAAGRAHSSYKDVAHHLPRPGSEGNTNPGAPHSGPYEERRNSAACFANPNRTEPWHADFVGIAVVEGLRDGAKCWVSVKKRLDRNGKVYVTVTLKPMSGR